MWLFVALLVALVGMIGYALWASRRRLAALTRVAEAMGWAFTPGDVPAYAASFAERFVLFQAGRAPVAYDLMRGTFGGRPTEVLGVRFTTGPERRPRSHAQTVVHVEDPALALPAFALRPAAEFRRLFGAQGFGNATLPQRPAFAAAHYLRAADPAAVAARFTDALVDALEAHPGLSLDGGGPHLFLFRQETVARVEALPDLLAEADAVTRAFLAPAPSA